jgi:hypothetical protein
MIGVIDLALACVPLIGLIASLRYSLLVRHLRTVGLTVPGQIVFQREWQNRGRIFFIPTVQFTTQAGELIETENKHQQAMKEFLAYQPVLVYYDPAAPQTFLFAEQVTSQEAYWSSLLWLIVVFFFTGHLLAKKLAQLPL